MPITKSVKGMNTKASEPIDKRKFEIGELVGLPFGEVGVLIQISNIPWGFKYRVQIVKATLSEYLEITDYKETQLQKLTIERIGI